MEEDHTRFLDLVNDETALPVATAEKQAKGKNRWRKKCKRQMGKAPIRGGQLSH